jgi:hypothetical protein
MREKNYLCWEEGFFGETSLICYFAVCRISVKCPGIEMGCESLVESMMNCLIFQVINGAVHD